MTILTLEMTLSGRKKKIEHIANLRKLEYFIDINKREEERLEVKIKNLIENKKLPYHLEIEELMKLYNININIEENNIGECKKKIKEAINKKNMEELSDELK